MSQFLLYSLCTVCGAFDRILLLGESKLAKRTGIKVVTFILDVLTAGVFLFFLFIAAVFNNGKFEIFLFLGTAAGFLTADLAVKLLSNLIKRKKEAKTATKR